MVSGFICGTSSLPRDDEEREERQTRSAGSSPRKPRSSWSRGGRSNPYSDRGLDKFSSLLQEIEEKRQQIYSKVSDPDEISLVRFAYSGDHDFIPIVVKAKNNNNNNNNNNNDDDNKSKDEVAAKSLSKLPSSSSMAVASEGDLGPEARSRKRGRKRGFYRALRVYKWSEPRFYLPMIVIFVLVALVIFGRSFAIMCTSIGWYVIPTMANNNSLGGGGGSKVSRMSFKRRENNNLGIRRLLSDKKIVMASEGRVSFKGSPEVKPENPNGNKRKCFFD